jgi:hypothetical protein
MANASRERITGLGKPEDCANGVEYFMVESAKAWGKEQIGDVTMAAARDGVYIHMYRY